MNILLVNGSPHTMGCTHTALQEVARVLRKQGAEVRLMQLGKRPVRGCIACGRCLTEKRCIFEDDPANELLHEMRRADGVVIGAPVYFGGVNGALCALLDRVFFAAGDSLSGKPAAAVYSLSTGSAGLRENRLHTYFEMRNMRVISDKTRSVVCGQTCDDALRDRQGLQAMRALGYNMAWAIQSGKAAHTMYVNAQWAPQQFYR